jgi:hypothetical protein
MPKRALSVLFHAVHLSETDTIERKIGQSYRQKRQKMAARYNDRDSAAADHQRPLPGGRHREPGRPGALRGGLSRTRRAASDG